MLPLVLAQAIATSEPHLTARRIASPPAIDGKLDDAAWARADATSAFTQKFPAEGAAPTEKTTVRVIYDNGAVYVGIECEQLAVPVVERLTRRDRQVEADWVSVNLGSRADRKSAFEFMVNASGVLSDTLRSDDTDATTDWDENWEAATARTPSGWSVEMKIPLHILRFGSAPVQSWDFQVRRHISMAQETDEWAYIPRSAGGEVSHYGKLDSLSGLTPSAPVELRPFAVARVRRRDSSELTTSSGTDFGGSVGMDVKWHPTQALTLDATINPDFAQVEPDQLVLNLTTFETLYPEKRPFFLEGAEIFATPRQLLYTRRIGRAPATPTLRTDRRGTEQLVDVPSPTTIYGASKITGKLGDGWTIGTLQALTARNQISVVQQDGTRQDRIVDPLTGFNVARVRREIGNAYVGAMLTATTHSESTDYPTAAPSSALGAPRMAGNRLCPAGNLVSGGARCFNDAYVAALDGRWRSSGGDWVAGGQAIATTLHNGPTRAVADGTKIRPGDVGTGAFGYVNKEGGQHWVGAVSAEYEGQKLDYTDLGYNQRSNDMRWRFDGEYRELAPWWFMLESHAKVEYFGRRSLQGLALGDGYQLNVSGKTRRFWTFFTEVHYRTSRFDDREVGDGTALERTKLFGYELELASDPRRKVSFSATTQTQVLDNGFYFEGDAGVLVRAHTSLDIEVLPTAIVNTGEPRFIGFGSAPGQYVFGRLGAKSIGTTLRTTYTLTPRLSLQAYGQLFLAAGHYTELSQFQSLSGAGQTVRLAVLKPYVGALPTNPDFSQGVVNVNVVLRWEYRLGSTLFLVYTRSQVPTTTLNPGQLGTIDLGAVNRAPASDVVLVKLTYWWG